MQYHLEDQYIYEKKSEHFLLFSFSFSYWNVEIWVAEEERHRERSIWWLWIIAECIICVTIEGMSWILK